MIQPDPQGLNRRVLHDEHMRDYNSRHRHFTRTSRTEGAVNVIRDHTFAWYEYSESTKRI